MLDRSFDSYAAILAIVSGAMMGAGYAFFNDEDERRFQQRSVGGAVMVLGLYVFAPAGLREAWKY